MVGAIVCTGVGLNSGFVCTGVGLNCGFDTFSVPDSSSGAGSDEEMEVSVAEAASGADVETGGADTGAPDPAGAEVGAGMCVDVSGMEVLMEDSKLGFLMILDFLILGSDTTVVKRLKELPLRV